MIDLQEIRLKHTTDLKQLLEDLLEEQFKLKMQAATGQLAKSSEFKKVRKDIARIKTIMKEKQNNV
jgi:large subunit ribosomal protein L29|tara:strand:+ start:195 stop:392 length:198 start_codon:yes stop_codon:yes gene_type:complete